ncbi:MAG: hypothetical protein ACKOCX_00030 [Planctomycetota bacterium]
MSDIHVINLSTAWQPPDPAAGRAEWIRRFGMPAGIEPGDRVWLVVEPATDCELRLGGERLPAAVAGRRWRHDLTAVLRERNELALAAPVAGPPPVVTAAHGRSDLPATIGRAWLEIEPAAGGPAAARAPA